jgi:hypothetical protein
MGRTVATVLTAIMAIIFALALCELGLRLWDHIPLRMVDLPAYRASFLASIVTAEHDPLLGWRHRAYRRISKDPLVNTGEFGLRMNSAAIKPVPRRAILAVGDSFTAGSDTDDHETYPAQLEAILDYPVINSGVGG